MHMLHYSSKKVEETRKLQITGGSTYIISLPKKWVIQNHLEKGSLIRIQEEGNILSLLPMESLKQQKREKAILIVSPKTSSESIIRKIVSVYLVGYDIIYIRAKEHAQLSSQQRSRIKNFVRHLLVGTEIVGDTANELTLHVLLSYPQLSIQSALRRMSIITSSMHKDAVEAIKHLNYQLARSVIDTDNEVDRFNLYIIRQLKMAIQNPRIIKEIGLKSTRECLGYRLITKSVERTADHAVNIAENILPLKKQLNKGIKEKIEELSTFAVSMFELAIESLFKQDYNLAESIITKSKEISSTEKEAVAYSGKAGVDEIVNLRLIIESMRRTAEYATDIAEIVLNLTIESTLKNKVVRKVKLT